MIFADCYGVAARGLQPAFSLPAGFPLCAHATPPKSLQENRLYARNSFDRDRTVGWGGAAMQRLEEYIAHRKKEDRLDEFNIDARNENMRIFSGRN